MDLSSLGSVESPPPLSPELRQAIDRYLDGGAEAYPDGLSQRDFIDYGIHISGGPRFRRKCKHTSGITVVVDIPSVLVDRLTYEMALKYPIPKMDTAAVQRVYAAPACVSGETLRPVEYKDNADNIAAYRAWERVIDSETASFVIAAYASVEKLLASIRKVFTSDSFQLTP